MSVELDSPRDLSPAALDLHGFRVDSELVDLFPIQLLFRESVLPLDKQEGRIRIAMGDLHDFDLIEELTAVSGHVLEPIFVSKTQIDQRLKAHFGVGGGTVTDMLSQQVEGELEIGELAEDASDSADGASVVKLVNELLYDAVQQQASDVHIEPIDDERLEIRFRIDGRLHIQPTPPGIHRFKASIVSRLKIMANLNIAEKRIPQDGRIQITLQGRHIDVRVSVIPMLGGEGVVLRLLDKANCKISLDAIALPDTIRDAWNRLLRLPHGLILVTGPTGSGKTTTLYSSIASLRAPDVKIITVEDPIEYNLEGINQIQVHRKVGLDFASGLRSILRHDPDVVLIGEVRDPETASIAVQASLTGHLVFCTLHTNDAPSAYARLVDMGVEPYLVSSSVQGILAQRLVRRLCTSCRRPAAIQPEIPDGFTMPADATIYESVGCPRCMQTGYKGRVALFELLLTNAGTRRLIGQQADSDTLRRHAIQNGMDSLLISGWNRMMAGETTLEEVARATTFVSSTDGDAK